MSAGREQLELAGHAGDQGQPISRERVEALIREHYAGLRLLVLKSTRNEATAADILNDAIATAWEHLDAVGLPIPSRSQGMCIRWR